MSGDDGNFTRLINRGMAVIISFISSFGLSLVVAQPSRVEITVIVVVLFVLWIMADRLIRGWFETSVLMKANARWRDLIIAVLDFLLLLGIFLVAQLFLRALRDGIDTSELSAVEVIVFILAIVLGGFAIVHTIKALKEPIY